MSVPDDDQMDRLLKLVNLLPSGSGTTRDLWDKLGLARREVDGQGFVTTYRRTDEDEKVFKTRFEGLVESLPHELKEFIGPLHGREERANEVSIDAMRKYNELVEAGDLLTLIASQNHFGLEELRVHKKPLNEANLEEFWYNRRLLDIVFSIRVTPLVIEKKGDDFVWKPSTILQAMQTKRGTLRVRQCRICSMFFWAGRIDQVACGPPKPCANRLRYRRYYNANLKSERRLRKGRK